MDTFTGCLLLVVIGTFCSGECDEKGKRGAYGQWGIPTSSHYGHEP
jgi:hypothetical protein